MSRRKSKKRVWLDEDVALDLLDHPPAKRSQREIDRLQAILDEIEKREPLAVEMLVSSDARRSNKGGKNL